MYWFLILSLLVTPKQKFSLSTFQPQFYKLKSYQTLTLEADIAKLAYNLAFKEAKMDVKWKPLCEEMR